MSIQDFIEVVGELSDEDFREFFDSPDLQQRLQESMLGFGGGNVYAWMLENKLPWLFWSFMYRVISNRMAVKVILNTGHEAFISPTIDQLLRSGITFVQGAKRMEGLLCGYKDGRVSVAVVRRDIPAGQGMSADDLEFVDLDERGRLPGDEERTYSFREAENVLRSSIKLRADDEAAFQEYFGRFPWVFGLQYNKVQSHRKFNDETIPDFTAVNSRNGLRDIIEIKPPGTRLFGKGGAPLAAFHSAIAQCERYIDFADSNRDYLCREKGLRFDTPTAILVAGLDLDVECLKELRRKERLSPRLRIYTYNDILASISSMRHVVEELHKSGQPEHEPDA
jgi:hypothetical protein